MKTQVQANKANNAIRNSVNHMNGMNTYMSNGRVYQSQKYMGPLNRRTKILSPEEKRQKNNDTVIPQNIRAVERYLGRKGNFPTMEIIKIYNLQLREDYPQGSKGIASEVFKILCERYPLAKNYKGWNDIYMSMRNCFPVRKEPMKITKIHVDEKFSIDECKPLYKVGDEIYCVQFTNDKFEVFRAKVLSYYIKELSNGTYDIMYELKSSCFGVHSGWKLQGNKTVFATKEEAQARADERNASL